MGISQCLTCQFVNNAITELFNLLEIYTCFENELNVYKVVSSGCTDIYLPSSPHCTQIFLPNSTQTRIIRRDSSTVNVMFVYAFYDVFMHFV